MGLAGHIMAMLLAATMGGQPAHRPPSGGVPQDVDAALLKDLELLRMLDVLQDLDAIKQMDDVMGPPRGERKSGRGKAP